MSRDDYLALTPERYLAGGFCEPDGRVRRALLGEAAMAAATQLAASGASPQELAFTYEAIRALLPLHADEIDAGARQLATLAEALATVARMIRQPNNEGILSWSRSCASFVRSDGDIEALLAHMQAVLRLLELLARAAAPDEGSAGDGSSGPDSPVSASDGAGG
jgi:hypothetical protein